MKKQTILPVLITISITVLLLISVSMLYTSMMDAAGIVSDTTTKGFSVPDLARR